MQEGYIFNDTIASNIAVGDDNIDKERLKYSVHIANIQEFIESLPLGYNTKIGMEGIGGFLRRNRQCDFAKTIK
jgi:ATP-binding cassette subfamily B protein